MAGEQTEKPTRKKLEDARKKGQVARSRDLALAAASVAATFALARLGGHMVASLSERLSGDLSHFGDNPLRVINGPEVSGMVLAATKVLLVLVGPIGLVTMAAGVGIHGFQGGWNFAPEALEFKWERLSPASGMKRFKISQSLPDTLKMMITVTVLAYLGWGATRAALDDSVRMAWLSPGASALLGWSHAETLLWRVGWSLGVLALGDYALQRYRMMQSLKMSRQDVRDEARQAEGNAEMKGRVRRVQRDMARRRMISDVGRATVVITNPTHFAIALEYHRDSMGAPRVLAKGRDHLAARIRKAALEHGVPIVENKPLAQTLYKTTEVGESIPAELFAAVAEVLAYLVRIKQLML